MQVSCILYKVLLGQTWLQTMITFTDSAVCFVENKKGKIKFSCIGNNLQHLTNKGHEHYSKAQNPAKKTAFELYFLIIAWFVFELHEKITCQILNSHIAVACFCVYCFCMKILKRCVFNDQHCIFHVFLI